MSRIYEALQRAEIERKETQDSEVKPAPQPVRPTAIPTTIPTTIDEPLIARQNGARSPVTLPDTHAVENTSYSWDPALPSLPSLLDRGEGVEQFRSLRSRIYQFRHQAPLKTILISSGMPSEGKTFVATNLALNLARNNDRPVLLIDGDLRRPSVHKLLGAPNQRGLADFLAGTAGYNEIMQRDRASETLARHTGHDLSNLTFIPAGEPDGNTIELAGNHRFAELIDALEPQFDWIIIDSPPVMAVTDAIDLARSADAVLLVARGEKTPFDVAQRAQAAFSGSRILGFVLNAVKDAPSGRNYYKYYGSETGAEQPRSSK
jgi:capsular exopolysaccharide synthesis family protein